MAFGSRLDSFYEPVWLDTSSQGETECATHLGRRPETHHGVSWRYLGKNTKHGRARFQRDAF